MFVFLNPEWLLGVIPLILVIFWVYYNQTRSHNWHTICDPELLKEQLVSVGENNIFPIFLLGLAWFITILALAGPSWTVVKSPVFKSNNSTVILLDLSREMLVKDPHPNRLTRAKYKISDLLRATEDRQYGLAVYSSESFTVSPLTNDGHTIDSLLTALDPNILPIGGRNIVSTLEHARDLLLQGGQPKGDILLVTTGTVSEEAIEKSSDLQKKGITVSVLGVGTMTGGPIPLETGFLKDNNNQVVLSKLNKSSLKKLAKSGGGKYITLSHDKLDISDLVSSWGMNAEEVKEDLFIDRRRNDGYWLLWFLVPLVSLVFSIGWRKSVV